jgi:succinate dehydrogenase / fumarate reductase cytochrome b subunit
MGLFSMAEHPARVERPLSPHLQIYRLTFTFVMSGFHRVTGIVTYLGWWLGTVAVAAGRTTIPGCRFFHLARPPCAVRVQLGLIHHSLGGVRR